MRLKGLTLVRYWIIWEAESNLSIAPSAGLDLGFFCPLFVRCGGISEKWCEIAKIIQEMIVRQLKGDCDVVGIW